VQSLIGKRLFTHSFRVSMITELLQAQPIQQVKHIVGHRDIRTTEVYDRNFMGEHELRKVLKFIYNSRSAKAQKPTS
jgi:site-specific recombinase XerD